MDAMGVVVVAAGAEASSVRQQGIGRARGC